MERAKPNRNGKNEIRVTIPGIKMRTKKRPSTCNPVKTRKKTERAATMGSTQKIFFKIGAKSSVIKGQRNFGIRNTTPVLKKNHDRKMDNQTIRREAPRYHKELDLNIQNQMMLQNFGISRICQDSVSLNKVKKSSSILKSSISKGKSVLKEDSTSKLLSSAQAQVEKNFKKLQKGSPTKNEQNKMAKTASNFRSSRSKPTQCKKNSRLYHIKTNNYMENTNIFKKALNQGNKICKNHTRLNKHYPSRLRHQNFVDEEDFLKNTRNQEKPLIIQNFIALEPSVKPQVALLTTQHSRLSKPVSKTHLLTKKSVEDCYQEFMRDLNEPEPDQTLFFKEIYKPA